MGADVIVTTSGMLDGGPAIWYLNRLRHNSANAILLTGYQAEGSGGRRLLETGALSVYGRQTRIPLEIDKFDLSNHADHDSICEFVRKCSPEETIIFHAEEEPAQALANEIAEETRVHIPSNTEILELG